SSASRKACERKGLSAPAQASHSAAGSSAMRSITLMVKAPAPSGIAMLPSGAAEGGLRQAHPPLLHLEHRVDLDGEIEGQDVGADGGAGVAAGIAQHIDHEV